MNINYKNPDVLHELVKNHLRIIKEASHKDDLSFYKKGNSTPDVDLTGLYIKGPSTSLVERNAQFKYSDRYIFDFFARCLENCDDSVIENEDEKIKFNDTKAKIKALLHEIFIFYIDHLEAEQVNIFINQSVYVKKLFKAKDISKESRLNFIRRFSETFTSDKLFTNVSPMLFNFDTIEELLFELDVNQDLFTKILLYISENGDIINEDFKDKFQLEIIVEYINQAVKITRENSFKELTEEDQKNFNSFIEKLDAPTFLYNMYSYLLDVDGGPEKIKPRPDAKEEDIKLIETYNIKRDSFNKALLNLFKEIYKCESAGIVNQFIDDILISSILLSKYDFTNNNDERKYTNAIRNETEKYMIRLMDYIDSKTPDSLGEALDCALEDSMDTEILLVYRTIKSVACQLMVAANQSLNPDTMYRLSSYIAGWTPEYDKNYSDSVQLCFLRFIEQIQQYINPIINARFPEDVTEFKNFKIEKEDDLYSYLKKIFDGLEFRKKMFVEELNNVKTSEVETEEEKAKVEEQVENLENNIKYIEEDVRYMKHIEGVINNVLKNIERLIEIPKYDDEEDNE